MMLNDRLSQWNPLRGLTLEGLVNYFELGDRGYYADPQWVYRFILRRNGTARAVARKLKSAIERLDHNIKIPDDLDGERLALAQEQQQALRTQYDAIENLASATVHLAFADVLGFAHVNKVYAGFLAKFLAATDPAKAARMARLDPMTIVELRAVPQWHLCRNGLFAPWEYNPDARMTNRGMPIDPKHWIFREVDDPAVEIFALAHLKMGTTDADWDQFCDTYSVPPLFMEGPPNSRKEDEPHYQAVAEQVVSDGRGYIPNGAKVHSVQAGSDGVSVFVERLHYYREEIVLAGTGGILTTLDGHTGLGKGAADNHDDTWLDIAASVSVRVTEAFRRGIDEPVLNRLFPGEEHLAYFELSKPERDKDTSGIFQDAQLAHQAGFQMDPEELGERTGYKLTVVAPAPAPGQAAAGNLQSKPTVEASTTPGAAAPHTDPQPPAGSGPSNSAQGKADEGLLQEALAKNLGVSGNWLAPVADVFDQIQTMLSDPNATLEEITAALDDAATAMPELLGNLNVQELAGALENATGPAAIQGLADGLRAKVQKTP